MEGSSNKSVIHTSTEWFDNVSYVESDEKKKKVWDLLISKFLEYECFSPESVMQGDSINIASPEILSELVEIINFQTGE
jgi:hypothetical protein